MVNLSVLVVQILNCEQPLGSVTVGHLTTTLLAWLSQQALARPGRAVTLAVAVDVAVGVDVVVAVVGSAGTRRLK